MQIVIDIPDHIYRTLIETGKYGYYAFDAKKAIKNGTPLEQEPKTGHWVFAQRDKYVDIKCSECENVRVKEYAYNYTVEQVLADKENIAELFAEGDMQHCPYCGAKMAESEVRNDKS